MMPGWAWFLTLLAAYLAGVALFGRLGVKVIEPRLDSRSPVAAGSEWEAFLLWGIFWPMVALALAVLMPFHCAFAFATRPTRRERLAARRERLAVDIARIEAELGMSRDA